MQRQHSTPLCTCEQCSTQFVAKRHTAGRFCSIACVREAQRQARAGDWYFAMVDRSGECWNWTGWLHPEGYGLIWVDHRMIRAHRFMLAQAIGGPIPPGKMALHTCDNRGCVRNDDVGTYEVGGVLFPRWGHLWLGTGAANLRDMAEKRRGAMGSSNGAYTHPERRSRPTGESNANAKLRGADVIDIRQRCAAGETQAALAAAYGVHPYTISQAIRGLTWKHLPTLNPAESE